VLDTRAVIAGIFAEAARGDLDGVMSWWAFDGTLEDVTLAKAFTGHGQIRPYLEMYFQALAQVTYTPIRLAVDGPTAMVEWAQTATVAAPFDGTQSVGRTLFLRALDVFHVRDGLVQHETSWYGDGWLRQRLGGDPPGSTVPPPLPVTPPVRDDGWRF